jgi:hypothetical protein
MEDKTLICENCGRRFDYPVAEQQFYEGQGIQDPKICKDCRRNREEGKSEEKGEGKSGGVGGFNA